MHKLSFLLIIGLFLVSCSDGDKLADEMIPRIQRVVSGLRLEYSRDSIPKSLQAQFTIYKTFNDLTEEELTEKELESNLSWSMTTDGDVTMDSSYEDPRVLSFFPPGNISLTASFENNGKIFQDEKMFPVVEPALVSLEIIPVLDDEDLTDCCPQITSLVAGHITQGCLRQYKAIGTYDNETSIDHTDSTPDIIWSTTTTNIAQLAADPSTDMSGFAHAASCTNLNQNGLVFAASPGDFSVRVEMNGITGQSGTINVNSPTLTTIHITDITTDVTEGKTYQCEASGDFNNETTSIVTDMLTWSTEDDSIATFPVNKEKGSLLTKAPHDDFVITASYITAESVDTTLDIVSKQLVSLRIDPADYTMDYNKDHQYQTIAGYDNDTEEPLATDVNWDSSDSDIAEVSSSGMVHTKILLFNGSVVITAQYLGYEATADLKVENDQTNLIAIQLVPPSIILTEGESVQITVKGIYENMSQITLDTDRLDTYTTNPGLFNIETDPVNKTFVITSNDVTTDTSVDASIVFTVIDKPDITSDTQITVYNTQLTAIQVIKSNNNVVEGTPVQLTALGTFAGFESGSPRVLTSSEVSWNCETDCDGSISHNAGQDAVITIASVDPTSDTYTITATVEMSAFPNQLNNVSGETPLTVYDLPQVQFESSQQDVTEDTVSSISVVATSSVAIQQDIIIPFTVSGDASADSDYTILSGTNYIKINASQTTGFTAVDIIRNDTVEETETIVFDISTDSLVNAKAGSTLQHTVTIFDDDIVQVYFSKASQSKNEDGEQVVVTVELDNTSYQEISIDYQITAGDCTADGKRIAANNIDYTLTATGSITIPAGESSSSLMFDISDDTYHEVSECLAIELSNPVNATLMAPKIQHITIIDNDLLKFNTTPDTSVTNTANYNYAPITTAFDTDRGDQGIFKYYKLPLWLNATIDGAGALTLSGIPLKDDVETTVPQTIVCISDGDNSSDFSYAPGAQTACIPFEITVNPCELLNPTGSINTPADYTDPANCGKPINYVRIYDGDTLTHNGTLFEGKVQVLTGGQYTMGDATVDSTADIELAGGTLEVISNSNASIFGRVFMTNDATIDIKDDGVLTYTHPEGILVGPRQLTVITGNSSSRLQNTQPIVLDEVNSGLITCAQSSGGRIDRVSINEDLNGADGLIDVQGTTGISELTINGDVFVTVSGTKTLTITDIELDFGNSLNFSGPGTLALDGTSNLGGTLTMVSGILDLTQSSMINVATDLNTASGTLLTSADTTRIALQSNVSVNSNQPLALRSINFNNYVLDLSPSTSITANNNTVTFTGTGTGTGTPLISESLSFSNNSHLIINGDMTFSDVDYSIVDSTVDLQGDFTINGGTLNNTTGTTFNTNDNRFTLNDISGDLDAAVTTAPGGEFRINTNQVDIVGNINLQGGRLFLELDTNISGQISQTENDSSIDIAEIAELLYTGGPLTISNQHLTFSNSGYFKNDNSADSVTLDNIGSILYLDGEDGMISNVLVDADLSPGKIEVAEDFVILNLTLNNNATIEVANSKTLNIGESLRITGGSTLNVDTNTSGKLLLHDIYLEANLTLTGDNITLAPDATLYVEADATLDVSQNLTFMDGLVVKDGVTLTLNVADTYTVIFMGGLNLGTDSQIILEGAGNLEFSFINMTIDDLNKIINNGTGTISPQHDDGTSPDVFDVYSFLATPQDGAIELSWQNPGSTFEGVIILGSTVDFPTSHEQTANISFTFNGGISDDTTTDTELTNGTFYYYTAFAYVGSDYTDGVYAMAVPTWVPDDLVSYYPFNDPIGDDYIQDGSGQGNHGMFLGDDTTSDMTYTNAKARPFDGANDYMEIDNPFQSDTSSDLDVEDFTLSLWVRADTTTDVVDNAPWHDGLGLIDGKIGNDQNDFGLSIGDGKVMFGVGGSNSKTIRSGESIADGRWYNITATRTNISGNISLYINGLNINNDTGTSGLLNSPSLLRIANQLYSNKFFNGDLDEVRLYKRVLTPTEIQYLYSKPQNLVAHYRFSNNLLDGSGNGNIASMYAGSTSYIGASNIPGASDTNRAFNFNGSGYIDTGIDINPNQPGMQQITLSAWIYPASNSNTQYVLSNRFDETGRGFYLYTDLFNNKRLTIFTGSSSTWSLTIPITEEKWQHIAVAYYGVNGGPINIYVTEDGVTSQYSSTEKIEDTSADLFIGGSVKYDPSNRFLGRIDDVRIYNRVLKREEIEWLGKIIQKY